jgi:hypothetical protein
VQIVSVAAVSIAALLGYAEFVENRAEKSAKAFCASTKLGEQVEALLARARNAGADERQTRWIEPKGQPRWLSVTFTGFTPISRHICSVEATDTVKRAAYVYLD